jgi:adenylyl-sulfate kinase
MFARFRRAPEPMSKQSTNQPDADRNITWHAGGVSADDRRALLGHDGCVVWLTGLSGSGKSTIAHALERRLIDAGCAAYVLDGDNVRHGLNSDLGFSPADRDENIRRVGNMAAMMAEAGLIAIVAFISPYRAARDAARQAAGERAFFEVLVSAPLDECSRRDPKGLYAKARAGEITDLTGVDAPYEAPETPDAVLDTATEDADACVAALMDLLTQRGAIAPGKD